MTKTGRPTKYDPDFHPEDFIKQSIQGKHLYQIARSWGICRDTLHEWSKAHDCFSDAFKRGREFSEAYWMDLFQDAATCKKKINPVAAIWYSKAVLGWTEKQEIKQELDSRVSLEGFDLIEPK